MTAQLMLALVLAPVVITVAVVCIQRPLTVTLPLFAASLPFGARFSIGSSPFGSVSSLLGLLLAVGLAVHLVGGRRTSVPMSVTVPLWLLFLGTAGATTLWSVDHGTT